MNSESGYEEVFAVQRKTAGGVLLKPVPQEDVRGRMVEVVVAADAAEAYMLASSHGAVVGSIFQRVTDASGESYRVRADGSWVGMAFSAKCLEDLPLPAVPDESSFCVTFTVRERDGLNTLVWTALSCAGVVVEASLDEKDARVVRWRAAFRDDPGCFVDIQQRDHESFQQCLMVCAREMRVLDQLCRAGLIEDVVLGFSEGVPAGVALRATVEGLVGRPGIRVARGLDEVIFSEAAGGGLFHRQTLRLECGSVRWEVALIELGEISGGNEGRILTCAACEVTSVQARDILLKWRQKAAGRFLSERLAEVVSSSAETSALRGSVRN